MSARGYGTRPLVVAALALMAGCAAELPAPPEQPTVYAPTLTNHAQLTLRGLKQASTAIVLSTGDELVALDELTSWSAPLVLSSGSNAFSVAAVDALGRSSTSASTTVLFDDDAPLAPQLEPVPPTTLEDEVTLAGTKAPGDRLEVNGSVRPVGSPEATSFTLDVALAPGANLLRVATLDQAGNESDVVELAVLRAEQVPFTVTTPAATVADAALTVSGTRGAGVEVLLGNALVVAAGDSAGAWSHDITLTAGANQLAFTGRIALERDSEADVDVAVFYDDAAPVLAVAAPTAALFVDDDTIDVAGTVLDATATTVEVCVGTCLTDASFSPATLAGDAFSATIDLTGRLDVPDGATADVVVRATDVVQRRSTVSTPVLIGRAPVELPGAGQIDLASGALYVEARVFVDAAGAVRAQLDPDGPPWLPATTRLSDAAAASAAAPQVAALPAGAAAAVWLEDSAAASVTAGEPGLVYAEVTAAGATRVVVVQGDVGNAVSSVGLAVAPGGALLAFSRADQVLVAVERTSGMAFNPPVAVSDATTVAPAHVRIARLDNGGVVVLWQESSDRDGTLDDVDVVARVLDDTGAAVGPIVLLSGDGADSTAPDVAALDDDTALIGWREGGAALVAAADVAALTAGTPPSTVDASAVTGSGVVSVLALAADGGRLAVCWIDDGAGLVGAGGPGLVVRVSSTGPAGLGAATVLSSAPVVSASCSLAGAVLHTTWVSGGSAFLQPRVLP